MNNITEGYFMHEGLIVQAKIIKILGIKQDYYGTEYYEINEELYPFINFRNALYDASEIKIQSCEDIKGRSKAINNVKKYVDKIIKEKQNIRFRTNKQIILNECIDYIFHKEPEKFKSAGYTHCGLILLYNDFGNIKEEYFNNNFNYEGNRKIYDLKGIKPYLAKNLNYMNGFQQGLQFEYFNDGVIKEEYTCDNGLIDGIKKTYYSTGHYAYSELYEKGILKGYV